jgi:hypothetical protein
MEIIKNIQKNYSILDVENTSQELIFCSFEIQKTQFATYNIHKNTTKCKRK